MVRVVDKLGILKSILHTSVLVNLPCTVLSRELVLFDVRNLRTASLFTREAVAPVSNKTVIGLVREEPCSYRKLPVNVGFGTTLRFFVGWSTGESLRSDVKE